MAGASGRKAKRAKAARLPSFCLQSQPSTERTLAHLLSNSCFLSKILFNLVTVVRNCHLFFYNKPDMEPIFLVFGKLTREYLLPSTGPERLDVAGGNLLYGAGGLRVWESEIGLVGRVGNDYPREWLNVCIARGFDTSGIRILPSNLDVREFIAYSESFEVTRINPVSHFARRGMTFPKSLLGYQPPDDKKKPSPEIMLTVTDIPADYLTARAALLCPMDIVTQTQLIAGMKRGSVHTFVLDPGPDAMRPKARRELPVLLNGVTAFLPSREELCDLFWGQT